MRLFGSRNLGNLYEIFAGQNVVEGYANISDAVTIFSPYAIRSDVFSPKLHLCSNLCQY